MLSFKRSNKILWIRIVHSFGSKYRLWSSRNFINSNQSNFRVKRLLIAMSSGCDCNLHWLFLGIWFVFQIMLIKELANSFTLFIPGHSFKRICFRSSFPILFTITCNWNSIIFLFNMMPFSRV